MRCTYVGVERYTLLPRMKLPWTEDGNLLYHVANKSPKLGNVEQRTDIDSAFARWNYHLEKFGKSFLRTEHKETAFVHIYFVGGETGAEPPEQYKLAMLQSEIVAFWAEGTGNIFIKDNMPWGQMQDQLNLSIAVEHEIGHLLGLGHTGTARLDVMYYQYNADNRITQDSIRALNRLYGKSYLPAVMDWTVWEVSLTMYFLYILYTIINDHVIH